MKIAVIDTGVSGALPERARAFLPKLLKGLTERGNQVHLFTNDATVAPETADSGATRETDLPEAVAAVGGIAPVLASRVNDLQPDVYLIWTSEALGWAALPYLDAPIATLAVGHADAETFYAPARHYRSFLTRVIGATPETCVGFVIGCVIDKERVEWISDDEGAAGESENDRELVETYLTCFEKAVSDAHAAPREAFPDFPPPKAGSSQSASWLSRLKAKIMK